MSLKAKQKGTEKNNSGVRKRRSQPGAAPERREGLQAKPSFPNRFYVVVRGRNTGIFSSYEDYHAQVHGFSGALAQSFKRYPDAVKWFRSELKKLKKVYYAVRRGWQTGVFHGEAEALKAVEGFAGAELKRFGTMQEAQLWLAELGDPAAAEAFAAALAAERSLAQARSAGRTRKPKAKEEAAPPEEKVEAHRWFAVYRGFGTGIFSSEEELQAAIEGFAEPEYQEFTSKRAARLWYERMRSKDEETEMQRQLAVILSALQAANDDNTELRITKVEKLNPVHRVELEPAVRARFHSVQFDRSLWQSLTAEECLRFAKGFRVRLSHLARVLGGEVRAAGNSLKLIRRTQGDAVLKRRLGKRRVSLAVREGIITLLRVSNHDRQMHDILNQREKCAGYVAYKLEDFVARLEEYMAMGAEERPGFTAFLCTPRHYVYDAQQQAVIRESSQIKNISLVGSAGAGKSLVGLACLGQELLHGDRESIYLTMSQNLVYTLGYEYERGLEQDKPTAGLTLVTTFAFMQQEAMRAHPEIPGRAYLDAAASQRVFEEFWHKEINWESFWEHGSADYALRTEEATRLSVWRELHGFLKGAIPPGQLLQEPLDLPEIISEETYRRLLAREQKRSSAEKTERWIKQLYRTARRYQQYLRRRGFFDDNDLARLLLSGSITPLRYGAAFLDECQDLTQVQLLALFRLLKGTRLKRLASDRCQMVQPTYFNEGQMRTLANEYERAQGHAAAEGIQPRYLYYNYRATKALIRLQNYLIGLFQVAGVLSLKAEELAPVKVPLTAEKGNRPVWIAAGEKNRRALARLWQNTEAGGLELLVARKEGQAALGVTAGACADIVGCKGMEYPAVLLYNLLTDMQFDLAMAWKYFYVGATRSHRMLLIYEEAEAKENVGEFLERAEAIGLLERCEDLEGMRKGGESWLDYLAAQLQVGSAAERLETAESALSFGQYRLAYEIWQSVGAAPELLTYVEGKIAEDEGDYPQAMRLYASLPESWQDRGRTRRNSVDTLLGQRDIAGCEFLGAWLLRHQGEGIGLLPRAKEAWRKKFGAAAQTENFYSALSAAQGEYPHAKQALVEWRQASMESWREIAGGWSRHYVR